MNRNNDFAMEYNDSLLKASERIRDLLKIKYHGDEYVADTTKGNNSDSILQTIIGKVNNATKLIYATELLFTNTANSSIKEDMKNDDDKAQKVPNQILELETKLIKPRDELKTLNEEIQDIETSIADIEARLESEAYERNIQNLEKTLQKYKDKLKSKLESTQKPKQTVQNLEEKLEKLKSFTLDKDKRDSNRPVNYVRGVNAYIDASNNFKTIELIMKEMINDIQKLLPDIGYCAPESITNFYDTIKDFDATNESLKKRLYSKYNTEVAKDLPTINIELRRIYDGYNKLLQNIALFYKSVDRIRETYNYVQSSANANSHNDSNYTEVAISNTEKNDLSGGSYLNRIRKLH